MISKQFLRFLVVGASNTLVAYGAYLLLLNWLPYVAAWSLGYLLGIASGYAASAAFVFNRPMRTRSAFSYLLVYLGQYAVSVALLAFTQERLGLPHWLAALCVICLTVPPTFLFVRWVMDPSPETGR